GDEAHFFLEDERMRLATQVQNHAWLQAAYGEDVLARLGDRPISCSGVTIGAAPAILAYLTVMVDQLSRVPRQPPGVDQAVHNVVLHTGLVPKSRLVRNGDGPVLTLGIMRHDDAEDLVRRRSGTASVVHQYDRHPQLGDMLTKIRTDARVKPI